MKVGKEGRKKGRKEGGKYIVRLSTDAQSRNNLKQLTEQTLLTLNFAGIEYMMREIK